MLTRCVGSVETKTLRWFKSVLRKEAKLDRERKNLNASYQRNRNKKNNEEFRLEFLSNVLSDREGHVSSPMDEQRQPAICSFPVDIMLRVLLFLPEWQVAECASVCREWRIILRSPTVWKWRWERRFGNSWTLPLEVHPCPRRNSPIAESPPSTSDVPSQKEIGSSDNATKEPNDMEWRSRYLTSVGVNRSWRRADGYCVRVHSRKSKGVTCLAVQSITGSSSSGSSNMLVAYGGFDQKVRLLSVSEDLDAQCFSDRLEDDHQTPQGVTKLGVLLGHEDAVWSVSFTGVGGGGGGSLLASGSFDSKVKIWDVETMRCTATFSSHTNRVLAIHCENEDTNGHSPDGMVYSAGLDRTCLVHDVRNTNGHSPVARFGMPSCVYSVFKDGHYIYCGTHTGHVDVFDTRTATSSSDMTSSATSSFITPVQHLKVSTAPVMCVRKKGPFLFCGDKTNGLKVMRGASGSSTSPSGPFHLVADLVGHQVGIRSIDIACQGRILVSGSNDKTVKFWSIEKFVSQSSFSKEPQNGARVVKDWKSVGMHSAQVTCVAATDSHLFSGSIDSTVRIWSFR